MNSCAALRYFASLPSYRVRIRHTKYDIIHDKYTTRNTKNEITQYEIRDKKYETRNTN